MTEFIWPIRVYYEDTDAGGVVFHANYLKFLERARTEMLRAQGFEQDELKTKYGIIFAVRSMQIDYLSPAKFNQLLEVNTKISLLKKASLVFQQHITHADKLICQATVTVVCLTADNLRPTATPQDLIVEFKE